MYNNYFIKQGIYIENNNQGYWSATKEQATAYNNFPIYKYTGMGSTYWMGNSKAIETVKGIKNTFYMIFNGDDLWLKTSDGILRHIIKINSPPLPPK